MIELAAPACVALGVALTGLAASGAYERAVLERATRSIRERVIVAGYRGRSSIVRLLVAALNAGERPAFGQIGGAAIIDLHPSGRRATHPRPLDGDGAHVARALLQASRLGAAALVIETASGLARSAGVTPAGAVLRPTRLVIGAIPTAATADDVAAWSRALVPMLPVGGHVYTTDPRLHAALAEPSARRKSELIAIDQPALELAATETLPRMRYREHAVNIAVAQRVAFDLGVSGPVARRAMIDDPIHPEAQAIYKVRAYRREIAFINAFAASDAESSSRAFEYVARSAPVGVPVVVVFACSADRLVPMLPVAADLAKWRPAPRIVLFGTGTAALRRHLEAFGADGGAITTVEDGPPGTILNAVLDGCGRRAAVLGLGLPTVRALELVRHVRNRGVLTVPDRALTSWGEGP